MFLTVAQHILRLKCANGLMCDKPIMQNTTEKGCWDNGEITCRTGKHFPQLLSLPVANYTVKEFYISNEFGGGKQRKMNIWKETKSFLSNFLVSFLSRIIYLGLHHRVVWGIRNTDSAVALEIGRISKWGRTGEGRAGRESGWVSAPRRLRVCHLLVRCGGSLVFKGSTFFS